MRVLQRVVTRRRISSGVSDWLCLACSVSFISNILTHVILYCFVFSPVRKNHVRVGYTSFNPTRRHQNSNAHLPKVRLRDTLPKESERQRQLQQQQADLEREQELADQLFNDVGAKSVRKRGKGSLDAFVTKSTAKRGRGRR